MFVFYMMATIFQICGLPGSGKTTLAKRLEHDHAALRLCPDEWISQILPDPGDRVERERWREHVEAIQWNVAKRALVLGTNIFMENGFWSRQERIYYRKEMEALGSKVELHYLEASVDELWTRLEKRNAALPVGTFHVDRDELEQWVESFEPPLEDEMPFLTHSP